MSRKESARREEQKANRLFLGICVALVVLALLTIIGYAVAV